MSADHLTWNILLTNFNLRCFFNWCCIYFVFMFLVCALINKAESTRYKEAVTQRATWTLCPITPPLTLLCRFNCVSDTHHWPSSSFDETLAGEREHKAGSLWYHVYDGGLESRWSAARRFISSHFAEALMTIVQGSTPRSTKRAWVCTVLDIFAA